MKRATWFLALAAMAAPAVAEVSVNADGRQPYFQARAGQTWSKFREGVPSTHLLNPFGDERGDGAPSIGVNPWTDLVEVAWGRAGARPGVQLGAWDPARQAWNVLEVPAAPGITAWAGRVVQLVHDTHGNRFIAYEDATTGKVLLASGPRDAHVLNRPLILNEPGVEASSPSMVWDGRALLVAFARLDLRKGVEVVELVPNLDGEGRIPNGGEGVPGIPEPVFQHASGLMPAGAGPTLEISLPGTTRLGPPSVVRLEVLPDERVLLTWVDGTLLRWTVRVGGTWTEPGAVELPDPIAHDEARDEVRRSLHARSRSVR